MERKGHYDVIVVGGGAAGLAAAIGAKKAGSKVLMIERSGCLGGQATNASVLSYCGFFNRGEHVQQVVYGVGDEILQKLKQLGYYDQPVASPAGNIIVNLDLEATKYAFELLAAEYGLEYLLHCRVIAAGLNETKDRIVSVTCVDDEGQYEFTADAFVDASGDANLGYLAGAPYVYGDGKGGAFMSTRVLHMSHVGPEAVFRPALVKEAILKAKADGMTGFTKETGIICRIKDDEVIALLPSAAVPSLDAEILTKCEADTRRQEYVYLEAFRKYFPGMQNARIVSGGASMGIRDTRHLVGEYTLTEDDVVNAVKQPDSVGCGAWPCEMHKQLNEMAEYKYVKEDDWYNIPLRCLKVKNIRNLWAAGRTISADHTAFASIRVMGIGFATGHAAGVAAAFTKENIPDAETVQKELIRQNAKI